jgi:2-methylisocitrate lyase-like PEP mutase family enzyme
MVEGGGSPVRTAGELATYGFRIAIYPAFLVHHFAHQAPRALAILATQGGTDALRDELHDLQAMNQFLELPEMLARAENYAAVTPLKR